MTSRSHCPLDCRYLDKVKRWCNRFDQDIINIPEYHSSPNTYYRVGSCLWLDQTCPNCRRSDYLPVGVCALCGKQEYRCYRCGWRFCYPPAAPGLEDDRIVIEETC